MSWKTGSNRRRDTGKRVKFIDTRGIDKSELPQDLVGVDGTRRIRDGETLVPPDSLVEIVADEEFGNDVPFDGEQPLLSGDSPLSSSSPLSGGSPLSKKKVPKRGTGRLRGTAKAREGPEKRLTEEERILRHASKNRPYGFSSYGTQEEAERWLPRIEENLPEYRGRLKIVRSPQAGLALPWMIIDR